MPKTIGEGSVIQVDKSKTRSRCREWKLQFCIESDEKRKYPPTKSKRIHDVNYTTACKMLEDFRTEIESDVIEKSVYINEHTLFHDALEKWLASRRNSPRYAKRTTDGEYQKMKNMDIHLGNYSMDEINGDLINYAYAMLLAGKSCSGKPLKQTSVLDIHKTTVTFMKWAIRIHIAMPDALDGVIIPKSDSLERIPLTNDQAESLIDQLEPTNAMHMLIRTYVTTGIRRSEAVAADWMCKDVRKLYIAQAAEENGELKIVKRAASNRTVPLTESTDDSLEKWRENQKILLAAHGIKQTLKTPMFTNNGNRYKPHSVTSWWERHREDFGLVCTLHDLRHTYATVLARKKVPVKVAAKLLGDSDLEVVNKIYTHVSDEDAQAAVALLNDIF